MEWKRQKRTIHTWHAFGFVITDASDAEGSLFRLEGPDASEPEHYGSLDEAKRAAALRNELQITREENERLRQELGERRAAEIFEQQRLDAEEWRPVPMTAAEMDQNILDDAAADAMRDAAEVA